MRVCDLIEKLEAMPKYSSVLFEGCMEQLYVPKRIGVSGGFVVIKNSAVIESSNDLPLPFVEDM